MNIRHTSHQTIAPKLAKTNYKDSSGSAKSQNRDSVEFSSGESSQQAETEQSFLERLRSSEAVAVGTPMLTLALGTGAVASLVSADPAATGAAMLLGFVGVGGATAGASLFSLGSGSEGAALMGGVGGALVGSIGAGLAGGVGATLGAGPLTVGLVTAASVLAVPAVISGLAHGTQVFGT